ERSLRAAERAVILLAILFHDTLERAVWNVGVAGALQKQIGEHARKPAVTVLKRMDRKKANDEYRDHEKRMMQIHRQLTVCPAAVSFHHAGLMDGRRCFENHAHAPAMRVESFDIIDEVFVPAAVILVALRELKENAMELLDVVLV